MKKIALILFLFVATASLFSQNNFEDVVYLKNGSIIRGMIIEQIPNQSIKIQTADRSVYVYQMEDIEKFTKEPIVTNNRQNINRSENFSGPGHVVILEVGHEFRLGDFGMDRLKLNVINVYQFNPNFSLGVGFGLRHYYNIENSFNTMTLMPIFVDIRTTFGNSSIAPFLSLGAGYSFDASSQFESAGFMLSPSFGARFVLNEKTALHFGIGYELQKLDFIIQRYTGYPIRPTDFYTSTENSGALGITIGLDF